MKKVLTFSFLFGILAYTSPALEDSSVQGVMNVTAKVVKPLTVTADSDLDFGDILPGDFRAAYSSFTLHGEENLNVLVSFEGLESDGNSYYLPLKSKTNGKPLEIAFNCTNNDGGFNGYLSPKNNVVHLSEKGSRTLHIAASTKPDSSHSGIYSGQIILRALYQ
ncbi:hypothetical protein [Cetobacterium sp.]|uniref:hypothetical protein n=1 Tax=Cetobacterium sp. TaxID=2071632 RepID=UPI003EE7B5A8